MWYFYSGQKDSKRECSLSTITRVKDGGPGAGPQAEALDWRRPSPLSRVLYVELCLQGRHLLASMCWCKEDITAVNLLPGIVKGPSRRHSELVVFFWGGVSSFHTSHGSLLATTSEDLSLSITTSKELSSSACYLLIPGPVVKLAALT